MVVVTELVVSGTKYNAIYVNASRVRRGSFLLLHLCDEWKNAVDKHRILVNLSINDHAAARVIFCSISMYLS